ncbi:hypothetical protein NJN40_14675 (plasmid) [Lacticaseibacillus paracasei]|nr:hypothetical protein [Lacticaseibacillus paracasei]MCG4283724.1 hypothetical protein [Lacticaseibacillus paracasei]UVH25179.1 hypothetical protein NJN40_14675 [Lacticaseibacillus paracasei]
MTLLNYRQLPTPAGLMTMSGGISPLGPVSEARFNPYPDTIPSPIDV